MCKSESLMSGPRDSGSTVYVSLCLLPALRFVVGSCCAAEYAASSPLAMITATAGRGTGTATEPDVMLRVGGVGNGERPGIGPQAQGGLWDVEACASCMQLRRPFPGPAAGAVGLVRHADRHCTLHCSRISDRPVFLRRVKMPWRWHSWPWDAHFEPPNSVSGRAVQWGVA